ncbi:amine oxidase [Beauveria bassiana ARSEF 2860]|uniref:Amine oxidase n=1 Tax=Beauveria bassiana (strain ARSEF 2860) TaxID=655819 RepID=J4KLF1_BEAB2|nr:amine oxidase [Beauveria bassiana ARSEF 2860]EJP62094.1 amine oxidase [Beauveria bassiana ARSEF 2860]
MVPKHPRPATELFNIPGQPDAKLYTHASASEGSNRLIFLAGQWGMRNGVFASTLKQQVEDSFTNLREALNAASASAHDVVKLTFYVVDWPWTEKESLVEPWLKLFVQCSDNYRPPTTVIPVSKLAQPEAKFEVEAIASIGGRSKLFNSELRHTAQPNNMINVDVVIVGAGFSGTQAAHDLSSAGFNVALLEATHRVGGRSKTVRLASGPGVAELGATWINQHTQPKIYATVKRLGLHPVQQYLEGDGVLQANDGKVYRFGSNDQVGNSPGLSSEDAKSFQGLVEAIDHETENNASLDINNTGSFPGQDDVSALEWVKRKKLGDFSLHVIRGITTAMVGREPNEIGIHYLLDYIKSGGGFTSLTSDDEKGSQQMFIREGTSAIAHGLAAELRPGSVIVNCPVDEIHQHGKDVIVTTATGYQFSAKKVIVAVPTNTYGKIQFTPPLPNSKRALASETLPGVYAKVLLTYASPWWRVIGLMGKFRSQVGPICFSWEVSNFEDKSFTLALFIAGDRATQWYGLSPLRRQQAVIEHLAELVGPDHRHLALDVLEYNAGEWVEEEWMGGAPTSAMPPGYLSKYGEDLRAPFRNVHFAGGETAREWKGYLEGALRAGSRAADEVIELLGKPQNK